MLPSEIVDYLEMRKMWSPATADYAKALLAIGISKESHPDFAEFYLHADDGPYFHGQLGRQLLQLCWHVLNTHYLDNAKSLKTALKIPDHFILLDSFEGEGGYFYDPHHDCVYDLNLGKDLSDFHAGKLLPKWSGFVDFLKCFFGIQGRRAMGWVKSNLDTVHYWNHETRQAIKIADGFECFINALVRDD